MKLQDYKSYISKDESIYLKGCAIIIMIFLHVFGSRAINLPAYNLIEDFSIGGMPLSYSLSKFCSICVHLYIFLSGYGFYIIYRRKVEKGTNMRIFRRIILLLIKVLLMGCIFYPISIFYPELGWKFDVISCVKLFLGYEGNYEWWFLRPYIVISIFAPFILRCLDKNLGVT